MRVCLFLLSDICGVFHIKQQKEIKKACKQQKCAIMNVTGKGAALRTKPKAAVKMHPTKKETPKGRKGE